MKLQLWCIPQNIYARLLWFNCCVHQISDCRIIFTNRWGRFSGIGLNSHWVTHSPTLKKTQRTPYDIFVENVDFGRFNKYLCTGDHFQSDLDIFRFKFMFVWRQTWVKVSSATELTQEVEEEQVSPTLDPPCRLYEKFENEVTIAWKMIHSSTFFCDPMSSDPPVYVSAEVQDPLLIVFAYVINRWQKVIQGSITTSTFNLLWRIPSAIFRNRWWIVSEEKVNVWNNYYIFVYCVLYMCWFRATSNLWCHWYLHSFEHMTHAFISYFCLGMNY